MKTEKKILADLKGVYSVAVLSLGGRRYYAAASENPGEHAYIFDAETGEKGELWLGDMGAMNVIQIPGEEKLLAITRFYPIFQSKEAEVCLLEPTDKGYLSPWRKTTVLHVPFVHRIGSFLKDGKPHLLVCTLCHDKHSQEDWSRPGAVYTCPIPLGGGEWRMEKRADGLFHNHGLSFRGGKAYITSDKGITTLDLGSLETEETSLTATGDIHVADGRYATIEPFHGDRGAVYDASGRELFSTSLSVGHAVWTGTLLGREAAIFSSRGDEKKLSLFDIETGNETVIDRGTGATQFLVIDEGERVRILAACHGEGTVSLYTLEA